MNAKDIDNDDILKEDASLVEDGTSPTGIPIFSIVIPARNEAEVLPKCIDSIEEAATYFASFYPEIAFPASNDLSPSSHEQTPTLTLAPTTLAPTVELVVVINRCTDSTEAVARARGAKIVPAEGKNLAYIRNQGILHSLAPYIITIDADSLLSKEALVHIYKALHFDKCSGGGVAIYPERWSLGILLTAIVVLSVLLWHRISVGAFYFTRTAFLGIQGFNENFSSAEDIDFARRLRMYGKAHGTPFKTLWNASITTSCRKFDTFGDWYFLLHPLQTLSLFKGSNQSLANKVWYDFRR